jgi:hypothetical protein
MSYAKNLLSRGEEVVYETRQHWFAVVARTWFWILGAVLALALVLWSAQQEGQQFDIATVVGLIALLLCLALIGYHIWDWRNQEFLITNRRVIKAEGILNKSMADSSLEKINDARLVQSLIGRIFNYGTLDILTAAEEAGGNNVDDFPMIADPVQFKVAMLNQKEMLERPDLAPPRYQRQGPQPELQRAASMPPRAGSDRVQEVRSDGSAGAAGPAAGPAPSLRSPADDLGETLEKLAGLRDRGLITPEEYESKKRELLERM